MKQNPVIIETKREAHSVHDVRSLTVGQLISELQHYDSDTPVILSFDSGYTFGGIRSNRINSYENTEYYRPEDFEEEEE